MEKENQGAKKHLPTMIPFVQMDNCPCRPVSHIMDG